MISPITPPPRYTFLQAKKNASTFENHQQRTEITASATGNGRITRSDHLGGVDQPDHSATTLDQYGCDVVDARVGLSEVPYAAGTDKAGASLLCSWLNANVATTYIEVWRGSGGI